MSHAKSKLAFLAVLVLILALPAARAVAQESFDLQFSNRVLKGQSKPAIIIGANTNMQNVKIKLTRDDGKVINLSSKLIRFGLRQEFKFDQEPGAHKYVMDLSWGGRKEPDRFEFDVVVSRPMEIAITKDTVDLEHGTITFTGSEAVAKVTLEIVGESGSQLLSQEFPVKSEPGKPTTITFTPPSEPIARVDLTAHDPWGFYNGIQMSPFFVQVPNSKEVNFETAKWDILPAEEPKLVEVLDRVFAALNKLGGGFQANLYVAGYTDTVGSNESNYGLSEKRARSISQWFRSNGLGIRACYQGFGEDALAVKTDDNVDEVRNRRTIFVIASQPPPRNATFPRGNWKCL